jgi:dTDP-4-amino-4,6-dideoxygalactose transaminase
MKVPALDLGAQHGPIRQEMLQAIQRVLDSQAFILGPEVERLEARVAEYCGAGQGIGVSSGTDSLLIALMALEIGAGDEVITTPYSFFATAGVIARLGAKPVFVDIDPITYNMDPKRLGPCITTRTRAIMPVHLFGQCAEMEPLESLAKEHGLPIVEDAAQAIGAEFRDGRRAGSMGKLGCFSFYPSKNLGAVGDAGMVVTRDPELAERVRILRAHGAKPKYHHHWIGGNFRLDAIQAAVLNVKLDYIDQWTRSRQDKASRYDELFRNSGLTDAEKVKLPVAAFRDAGVDHFHIYNQYVIRANNRDGLKEHLASHGIATQVFYPQAFHLQPCFRYLGHQEGDFPESERAARESLALPLYPEIDDTRQEAVVSGVREFYGL